MNKNIIVVFGMLVIIIAILFILLGLRGSVVEMPLVTNFTECKNAGYPIMESYPAQCRDNRGNNYVEVIDYPTPVSTSTTPTPVVTPTTPAKCYVGGCSGQICSDKEGVASTCEYREEYACYKDAKCERQNNGQCGWTNTAALTSCLSVSTNQNL